MVRRSYNAVIERNVEWKGDFATEPYEAAWASEAIFFIESLKGSGKESVAMVQISANGMKWCDEGTAVTLPEEGKTTFCRVAHFGGWLRLVGNAKSPLKVLVTLSLKE